MVVTCCDKPYCECVTHFQRAAIRDELLRMLPEVTERVLAAIRSEVPAYDALSSTQWDEVQEIAAWGVGRVLQAWVEDTLLAEEDLSRFRGIGAARAMDGRPLGGVLRAYRVAGSEVTELVRERASGRLTVDDAIALARLWMASIDALSEALYAGHTDADQRLREHPARARADLLDDLLTGRNASGAAVAARCRQLGFSLPRPLTVLTARSPRGGVDAPAWAATVQEVADGDAQTVLHGVRDDLLVAVIGRVDRVLLESHAAQHEWRVVLRHSRVEAVARRHRQAVLALERAPSRARRILDEVDVTVLHRLGDGGDVDVPGLRRTVLEPLEGGQGLLETLEALLATGNASAAASELGCHVQTVRYRLRRIREVTGRDLRVPWDRFVLESALLICHSE